MSKKKVLVIDDEEDYLKITKLNLEEAGDYEVMTLSNSRDVVSSIHSFNPDVILLDMLMPSLGGVEVCEMLNNDPIGAKIPIIMVSALDKHEDKLRAYRVGVVYYLSKPVGKDDLIAKIEKTLSHKQK
ncbi:MAG: response regulator [Candidatus Omnitrophota bacterium]|nr:response regulator [Candidatus Omnitrophota bacterium]